MNPDCGQETEISTAIDHFEALLGSKCRYQDNEEKVCVLVLCGWGWVGWFGGYSGDKRGIASKRYKIACGSQKSE